MSTASPIILVPPFVYRLPLPALDTPPTIPGSWQHNFDNKLRLHNIRMLISMRLEADEFHAQRSQKVSKRIQEYILVATTAERFVFRDEKEASVYHERVAKVVTLFMGRPSRVERVQSETEQTFRAMWKEMSVEEQEEFSLSNYTDAVRDLRQFVSAMEFKRNQSQPVENF